VLRLPLPSSFALLSNSPSGKGYYLLLVAACVASEIAIDCKS
jgi:hypothetical protein